MAPSAKPQPALADLRQMFRLVNDVRANRGQPTLQRRQVVEGVEGLLGRRSGFAELYGRPRSRALAWFLDWIGEADRPDAPAHLHEPPNLDGAKRRLFRLLVAELYRLHRSHDSGAEATARDLPPRQQQVLDRLLRGQAAKRIAWEMNLSRWTVDEHVRTLYARFGVRNRAELMARFIPPGPDASTDPLH